MSDLEQIEAAILSLPSSEFERLRLWLFDLDYEASVIVSATFGHLQDSSPELNILKSCPIWITPC
jgi:hypothetical protein